MSTQHNDEHGIIDSMQKYHLAQAAKLAADGTRDSLLAAEWHTKQFIHLVRIKHDQ
jgi:hypothetical protein